MNKSAVRAARMLLGWLALAGLTAPLYLLSWLPGSGRGWYVRLFRVWCHTFVRALGVDLRLHRKHDRPLPKRYLLIANHPSAFEDVGVPALFDVDCLAKIEVREWWLVGRISAAAGVLFVHRESRASRRAAAEAIVRRLEAGRNVALYPEGGVKGKRLHTGFRQGVFAISLQTGIPILPLFIHYEAEDDFHWAGQSLPRKLLEIMAAGNNRAHYYLHDAFYPEDFADRESYAQAVYARYLEWQTRYLD